MVRKRAPYLCTVCPPPFLHLAWTYSYDTHGPTWQRSSSTLRVQVPAGMVHSSLSYTLTSTAIPSRPFLFRSTSYDLLKHFRSAPHIHADDLSQDAWDWGVIRSDADYSLYTAPRIRDGSQTMTQLWMLLATDIKAPGWHAGRRHHLISFTFEILYHGWSDPWNGWWGRDRRDEVALGVDGTAALRRRHHSQPQDRRKFTKRVKWPSIFNVSCYFGSIPDVVVAYIYMHTSIRHLSHRLPLSSPSGYGNTTQLFAWPTPCSPILLPAQLPACSTPHPPNSSSTHSLIRPT